MRGERREEERGKREEGWYSEGDDEGREGGEVMSLRSRVVDLSCLVNQSYGKVGHKFRSVSRTLGPPKTWVRFTDEKTLT